MKYKVGIIGCGGIFPRHIEAIETNDEFELVAVCDIQPHLTKSLGKRYEVSSYTDYKEMIEEECINFVVIATPNSLHLDQSIYSLENGCDVLIEKPVSFNNKDIETIKNIADKNNRKSYCVLQVRLNPTVEVVKEVLEKGLLGNLRGFNFTQRWQRPAEYFSGWRGQSNVGGGILYETGIHYLDILQYLIGVPKEVVSTIVYNTKHRYSEIEDTVYSILDYGDFGGTIESTISAEPHNLESSISLMGSNGFIKIGGKALNVIESSNFLSHGSTLQFNNILKSKTISKEPNSYGSYQGSCPNHPQLYNNLLSFEINETKNVINLIEKIYNKANIVYENIHNS